MRIILLKEMKGKQQTNKKDKRNQLYRISPDMATKNHGKITNKSWSYWVKGIFVVILKQISS